MRQLYRSLSNFKAVAAWHRASRSVAGVLIAVAGAGCAAPQSVHLHTLMPAERPAPASSGVVAGRGPAIRLETVTVPAQVDQPQWLIRLPDGSLTRLEQERWASPLADELRQALLEILAVRYGAIEASPGAAESPWRVRVDVSRFDSSPSAAAIESTWTLSRAGATPGLTCTSYFAEPVEGGMSGLAEAHRRAVRRLGDAIGETLVHLRPGETGRCPAAGEAPAPGPQSPV